MMIVAFIVLVSKDSKFLKFRKIYMFNNKTLVFLFVKDGQSKVRNVTVT